MLLLQEFATKADLPGGCRRCGQPPQHFPGAARPPGPPGGAPMRKNRPAGGGRAPPRRRRQRTPGPPANRREAAESPAHRSQFKRTARHACGRSKGDPLQWPPVARSGNNVSRVSLYLLDLVSVLHDGSQEQPRGRRLRLVHVFGARTLHCYRGQGLGYACRRSIPPAPLEENVLLGASALIYTRSGNGANEPESRAPTSRTAVRPSLARFQPRRLSARLRATSLGKWPAMALFFPTTAIWWALLIKEFFIAIGESLQKSTAVSLLDWMCCGRLSFF